MPNLKKLKNGVTVLTDYVSSVETVCVGMWVYVGARNETKENNSDHFKDFNFLTIEGLPQ